jgi:hypothetical protein
VEGVIPHTAGENRVATVTAYNAPLAGNVGVAMFPPELERNAFRASNGEFGWTRAQIPLVVNVLRSHGIGILGGEL